MRGSVVLVLLLVLGLTGCGVTIEKLNERPDKYYQHQVSFKGHITRTQKLDAETLLEVADVNAHRVLVHSKAPVEAGPGDWVKVKGLLVPEARVGERLLYDVVMADEISHARRPWLAGIM